MAVSSSSKILLKSIGRLLYATLRCPPSTRNQHTCRTCCWTVPGSYKIFALVDHLTSIILNDFRSQNRTSGPPMVFLASPPPKSQKHNLMSRLVQTTNSKYPRSPKFVIEHVTLFQNVHRTLLYNRSCKAACTKAPLGLFPAFTIHPHIHCVHT